MTFIPESHLEKVRSALFEAGAGVIGNYDQCGFTVAGNGSFRAGDNANPFAGEIGKTHFENEIRLETILFSHLKDKVLLKHSLLFILMKRLPMIFTLLIMRMLRPDWVAPENSISQSLNLIF